jgi:type II secretory pathway pseudopilin PulG
MSWLITKKRRLFSGQRGIALLEILVGLAILAAITVTYINSLTGAYKGINISQEVVATESLAKSQIESIKVQDYVFVADYNPADPANRYAVIDIPADLVAANYTVEILSPELVIDGSQGFELQSVNVTVNRGEKQMMTISFYRSSG